MTVAQGVLVSGSVDDLIESDNVDVTIRRNPAQIAAVVALEVKGETTIFNPVSFAFTVEASAFFRSQVFESIEFFDYDAGEFVEVDSRPASRFTDIVVTAVGTGDLARFVEDGTGCVRSRIVFTSAAPRQSFSAAIDQVFWSIN